MQHVGTIKIEKLILHYSIFYFVKNEDKLNNSGTGSRNVAQCKARKYRRLNFSFIP